MKIFSKKNLGGFTLIEMIVVIAIVAILTGIAIFNWVKYNDRIELNGSAQKIILGLRQAQVWGTATKEFPPGSGLFNSGFGVHFNTAASASGQFIFFADNPTGVGSNDGKYNNISGDCGSSNECIEKTVFKHGYTISMCAGADSSSCAVVQDLDVVFTRPSIGSKLTGLGPIINSVVGNKYTKITINSSRSSDKKYIEVDNFGNIRILP